MKHVIIIGLDGLSWNVLKKLSRCSIMENVDAFRKNGVYADLNSTIPPFTVPAWTSLATGVNPGKHGAYSFLMPTKDYSLKLTSSKDVKYPRIHEICTLEGLNSVVINLPLSYPPITLKGIMISDWLYPGCKVFPEKAKPFIKDYVPLDPSWAKYKATDYVKIMLKGLEKRLDVIKRLFSRTKWSVFFVVFSEPDFVLHKMYFDIMSDKESMKEVYKLFRLIDNMIEYVMKNCPRNSLIFLVSDHGFAAYEYVVRVNTILENAGLAKCKIIKRKKRQSRHTCASRKVIYLPETLYRWTLQIGPARKMLSSIFHALFGRNATSVYAKALDMYTSLAFMLHTDHFGIYANSKDIFRNGTVEGNEVETVLSSIQKLLTSVKNPETNENIFEEVNLRNNCFHGPYVKNFPHVIFFTKKKYWVTFSIGEKILEKKRQANHRLAGMFAACGQDIKQGVKLNRVSVFDIVPTILHFLNLPIPHDTDGRVLLEMFSKDSEIRQRSIRKANYLERWKITCRIKSLRRKGRI